MSEPIRGDKLPRHLQQQVLATFVHRWTHENARQSYQGQCPGCRQAGFPARSVYITGQALPEGPKSWTQAEWHAYHVPLISDAEWLTRHAFYVTKKGTIDKRRVYAAPAMPLPQ